MPIIWSIYFLFICKMTCKTARLMCTRVRYTRPCVYKMYIGVIAFSASQTAEVTAPPCFSGTDEPCSAPLQCLVQPRGGAR